MPPKPKSAGGSKAAAGMVASEGELPEQDPEERELDERELVLAQLKLRLDATRDNEKSLRNLNFKVRQQRAGRLCRHPSLSLAPAAAQLETLLEGERVDIEDIKAHLIKELGDKASLRSQSSHPARTPPEAPFRAAGFGQQCGGREAGCAGG